MSPIFKTVSEPKMTDAEKPNDGELILHLTQEGGARVEVL